MSDFHGRLQIENVAGIKHLELKVKPFTVLIGPQSVGKSVVSKLLYFFNSIPSKIANAANEAVQGLEPVKTLEDILGNVAENLLPDPAFDKGVGRVSFALPGLEFECVRTKNGGWKTTIPVRMKRAYEPFSKAVKGYRDAPATVNSQPSSAPVSLWYDMWRRIVAAYPISSSDSLTIARFRDGPLFVPAGRAIYSQVSKMSIFGYASIDRIYAEFGKTLAMLRKPAEFAGLIPKLFSVNAEKLAKELLGGDYRRTEEGVEFLDLADGRSVPAHLWSSGQQEAHPLILALKRRCNFPLGDSIFVEEPEAHLFPESQYTIVRLIALAFNATGPNHLVFITTHSPYILTAVNNLIQAGSQLKNGISETKKARVEEVIPKHYALKPDYVGAYYMDHHKCRPIIAPDTGLIEASAIDDVSEEIAEEFDKLLEIER